jgi:hypothetical protein
MYNRKDKIPPHTPEDLEVMKQGIIVGEHAQLLFKDGIKIEREFSPINMNKKSVEALAKRKPLFEAGFTFKRAYALADILLPVGKDEWDLIEVKSSASLKEDHIKDIAFQKYVYSGCGLKIRNCYLLHIDKSYERNGPLDVEKLFKKREVTEAVNEEIRSVEENIDAMLKNMSGPEPEIKAGEHCSPYCLLYGICWDFLPKDHVFLLRSGRKIALDLMQQDILQLKDVPDYIALNHKQSIQVQANKSNKPFIDKKAIREFLGELEYPLYFLDFETMAPAIPIYDKTHPYQDIPFQFSLYVVEKEGAEASSHSYLADGQSDPRPELLKRLKKLLGKSGSIVAYNAAYEMKCLGSATTAYPEFADWFESIKDRFVDLLEPFRNFSYYHPAQEGSASLKNVLPALTKSSYEGMDIADGRRASSEYLRITFGNVRKDEQQRVKNALLDYCDQDTRGMVEIINELVEISR